MKRIAQRTREGEWLPDGAAARALALSQLRLAAASHGQRGFLVVHERPTAIATVARAGADAPGTLP